MKPWLRVLLISAVPITALAIFFAVPPKEPPKPARNVILISIDTLRADHLGCYGYDFPTSPQIDAFASRGALFEKAISSSGWTVPAHMTMLTGFDPLEHGATGYPKPGKLTLKIETLAEILKRNGFRTAGFVGGGFLWPRSGFPRGFRKYSSKGRHFTDNVDNARDWVRKHHNEPFFLFFHGYDVHRPYTPSSKNARRFVGDYKGRFDIKDLEPDKPRPSEEDLRFAISQYDAEIRDVDDLLGGLLAEWEEMGVLDDTLVVIVSDHGDEFYEHGQVYHAHSLYDELLHVPLIMVGPGIVPGRHSGQVGLIDVTPTILSALGLGSENASMHGVDLMPVARGEAEPPERLLFSALRFSAFPYSIAALRSDQWKLIAWDVDGMRGRKFRRSRKEYTYKMRLDHKQNFDELFDLSEDPREQQDVAAQNAETRNHLASILQTRIAAKPDHGAARKMKQPKLSPKEIEDLEALGYL